MSLITVPGQDAAAQERLRAEAVAIYLDCQRITCDRDFIQTEIGFVAHVRDRQAADVHVLVTGEPTGPGGLRATVTFIGQREFAGADETLQHVWPPDATQDELRSGLVRVLRRGLVRYANRTVLGEHLTVTYIPPEESPLEPIDPWDRWTMTTTLHGFVIGEEQFSSRSIGLAFTANRTTEAWKINGSIHSQYNTSRFGLTAGEAIVSVQRSYAVNGLLVKSVGEHWSAGARGSLSSSSFLNQSLTIRAAPALEYNFFPFREATRRMLTLEYSVGLTALDYEEETLFGRTSQRLVDQRLLASLVLTQPWGAVALGVEGSHHLTDWSKNRGVAVGNVSWNLARGLSLNAFVSAERIRDQIFLPARGASDEEILLRERQLATSYSYSASAGISYRFGSRHAAAVNRRFAGSVAGMTLIQ